MKKYTKQESRRKKIKTTLREKCLVNRACLSNEKRNSGV